MALTIDPKSKLYQAASIFSLKASAFDNVNYRPSNNPPNYTITSDTPNGVLGGMLAKMDYSTPANLVVDICTDANNALEYPIGFFNLNSTGNAFENAPAPASGKVAVFHGCGTIFGLYVFETHDWDGSVATPFNFATDYKVGDRIYAGPYGLVTHVDPSVSNVSNPGVPVGIVVKTPTTSDLEMFFKTLI